MFLTSDTVWLSRGTVTDDYGSTVPSDAPLQQGIAISITSANLSGVNSETGRAYSVEQLTALVDPREDIRQGDFLHSERSDNVFEVVDVGTLLQQPPFIRFPLPMELRRITT
jgi:hypothetical protein